MGMIGMSMPRLETMQRENEIGQLKSNISTGTSFQLFGHRAVPIGKFSRSNAQGKPGRFKAQTAVRVHSKRQTRL